jgi:hypothetical protein
MITGLRPSVSETGPATSSPSPMPPTKAVSTSWARFTLPGDSSAAICGSAGSMESMEKAMTAKISASMAMNSGRGCLPAAREIGSDMMT